VSEVDPEHGGDSTRLSAGVIFMIVVGLVLLAPGMCSLVIFANMVLEKPTRWYEEDLIGVAYIVWFGTFLISLCGTLLIRLALLSGHSRRGLAVVEGIVSIFVTLIGMLSFVLGVGFLHAFASHTNKFQNVGALIAGIALNAAGIACFAFIARRWLKRRHEAVANIEGAGDDRR